jgi:hypothetical protein
MADKYNDFRTSLPASYVRFIEAHSGWEGDLGDDLGYVVLWDPASIQDRWESYQMAEFVGERWFPFGSDGGDEMLCFDLPSGTDRVFHLPYIGMSAEKPLLRYESFSDVASAILNRA